jgi:hypothetical protein
MSGLFGGNEPDPIDPVALANAQAAANVRTAQEQARLAKEAAIEQQRMAMSGQVTPFGSLQYVKDPTSPSGYRAIQQFSPEQQALLGQGQDLQAQYGNLAGTQLGRVEDVMSTPFDLNAARAEEITDIQQRFLTPQWDQRKEALEADLLNRGIRPGSEQYENMTRQFSQSRDDSYDKMFLDAWQMANQAALTERNIPITDLNSLGIGAFPQGTEPMGFGNTPSPNVAAPGVAPTDLITPTMQAYNAQMGQSNAQMGGLFGLGSSLLGGWAQSGFPGAAAGLAMLSDRRLKTEIKKIGDDPRGWGVYLFTYLMDGMRELGTQIGFMADEVEKKRPEVVITDERTGFKAVNYGALALA